MNQTKMVSAAQKVQAFAIGFIGAMFFSMGTSYFSPQIVYRVPRLLVPVFELLGGVGLAVALLLLGVGLIWWGLSAWKKNNGKTSVYCILAAIALAVGIVLFNVDFKTQGNSTEIMEDIEQTRQTQIDEIRNTDRPDFGNDKADAYFDEFEILLARFKKSIEEGSDEATEVCEKEFEALVMTSADALQELDNDAKHDFAAYNARLMLEWNDLRVSE